MSTKNIVFENFNDYWHLTSCLNEEQRTIIFNSLAQDQQKKIQKSYHSGGWEDLFMRNKIDSVLQELITNYNVDLSFIRAKVLSGKSHYMKKSQWDFIKDIFKDYNQKHTKYIFGGISAEKINDQTVLIKKCDE